MKKRTRKTTKRRTHKGGSILGKTGNLLKDLAKEGLNVAKQRKVLSAVVGNVIDPRLGKAINKFGYGNTKPKRRTRRKKGGSFFGDLLGGIASVPLSAVQGATVGLSQGLRGLGNKKGGAYKVMPASRPRYVMY